MDEPMPGERLGLSDLRRGAQAVRGISEVENCA